jgi:hypothetical protein
MREQFVLQVVMQDVELGVEIFVEEDGPAHNSKYGLKNIWSQVHVASRCTTGLLSRRLALG